MTFAAVYSNIIMANCVSCHMPGGVGVTLGKLDMSSQATAFMNLVGQKATMAACGGASMRVVAGSSATSVLYAKVNTTTCGNRMPSGKAALSAANIATIKAWIDSGAGM